ncbi:MAG: DUF721 domain-containing protein [Flavobacteriales bacterium]|nr:DUF721 domain-containing protein [Flavobacteriales bacterium]
MSDKNQYQLKDLLKAMLKQYKLEDKYEEVDLNKNWPHLMGTLIANHTTKLQIRDKKLYVELDSPVIRQEMSYGKSLIIEKVNQFAGQELINDVVLR